MERNVYLRQYVDEFYTIAETYEVVYIGTDLPDEYAHSEYTYDFWEKMGFTVRNDLIYRNKALVEMVRIDT